MFDEADTEAAGSYWPSVSDLFMTLFIISLVLIGTLYYVLLPKNNVSDTRPLIEAIGTDLRFIREPVNAMRVPLGKELLRGGQAPREVVAGLSVTADDVIKELATLHAQVESLQKRVGGLESELNDKPPIIRIDEGNKEYRFASGSAAMSGDFLAGLEENEFKTLAGEILKRNNGGTIVVDTLEIIGYTDGQAVRTSGNLDDALPNFLSGRDQTLERLRPGSNNDLGLLRSLAVKKAWEQFAQASPGFEMLRRIDVRCYSAGQTIPPEPVSLTDPASFTQNNPKARRIEIRLTKLK
jgi:hypothetical protein